MDFPNDEILKKLNELMREEADPGKMEMYAMAIGLRQAELRMRVDIPAGRE